MRRTGFLIGALLMAQGCTYAISSDLARQADKAVTFTELEADPISYIGKLVILGGTIDRVRNTARGAVVEITQKKLDRWGKPLPERWARGEFVAIYPGFLDAKVYAPGLDITVAGVVEGTRHPGLEDLSFTSPVLLAREIKLWPRERPSWNRPQYLDPLYDPYTSPRQH